VPPAIEVRLRTPQFEGPVWQSPFLDVQVYVGGVGVGVGVGWVMQPAPPLGQYLPDGQDELV